MARRHARLRSRSRPTPTSPFPRGRLAGLPLRLQALLRLGEPPHASPSRSPWLDYVARFGLGPDDVPELLRLVTDNSLHVSDCRSSRGFGRLHAWRALAQLAAGGVEAAAAVAQPVLDLCLEHTQDEWLDFDGPHVLGLVGRPSLIVLRAVLEDPDAEYVWRDIALQSIGEVGTTNPSCREEVLDILLAELRCDIENAEAVPAQDRDESLRLESYAVVIISACLDMDAGRGPRGPEIFDYVRRAFATGLLEDLNFGPWPVVRKALETGDSMR